MYDTVFYLLRALSGELIKFQKSRSKSNTLTTPSRKELFSNCYYFFPFFYPFFYFNTQQNYDRKKVLFNGVLIRCVADFINRRQRYNSNFYIETFSVSLTRIFVAYIFLRICNNINVSPFSLNLFANDLIFSFQNPISSFNTLVNLVIDSSGQIYD